MKRKLPFHIQHNTTPEVVQRVLFSAAGDPVTPNSLGKVLQKSQKVISNLIAPELRKYGVLDGWRLSELGQRLLGLSQTHPDLLAEADAQKFKFRPNLDGKVVVRYHFGNFSLKGLQRKKLVGEGNGETR